MNVESISDELVSPFSFKKQFFINFNTGNIQDFYDLEKSKAYFNIYIFCYLINQTIGEGAYGRVVKALRKNKDQFRAIKIIAKSKVSDPEKFKNEIEILRTLDHPNVIKLYESYEDASYLYLVMEYCQGGELLQRMHGKENEYFSEEEARKVFQQIISALNYCHGRKICHRDLKPENFLYLTTEENSPLKIIDFGLSKMIEKGGPAFKVGDNNMKSLIGTTPFLAPEVLTGSYDERVDIWAAGVILYNMLCGYLPFFGDGVEVLIAIKHIDYNFYGPEFKTVSNECKNLIKSILTYVDKRITLEELMKNTWLYPPVYESPKKQFNLQLNIGHRITKFKGFSKLKKSLLCYIASQLSESEIGELRDIFLNLSDKDGRINFEQFEKGFNGIKHMNKDKESLKAIFEGMDVNHEGTVDYTEFLAAAISADIYLKEDKINSAFLLFDKKKTGKVSKTELKNTLGKHDYYNSKDDAYWEKILEDSDFNKDGYLDKEDFMLVLGKD